MKIQPDIVDSQALIDSLQGSSIGPTALERQGPTQAPGLEGLIDQNLAERQSAVATDPGETLLLLDAWSTSGAERGLLGLESTPAPSGLDQLVAHILQPLQ